MVTGSISYTRSASVLKLDTEPQIAPDMESSAYEYEWTHRYVCPVRKVAIAGVEMPVCDWRLQL